MGLWLNYKSKREFSYYYYCNIKFNSEWNLYFVLICFTEFEYFITPISLLVMNENNIIIKVNIKWLVYVAFYFRFMQYLIPYTYNKFSHYLSWNVTYWYNNDDNVIFFQVYI